MSDIDVIVSLPQELVEKARAQGVLNSQRIASLLEAELERIERWRALDQSLEPAREAFRADHPDMTEDEIIAMINDMVHETRNDSKESPEL